MNERVNICEPCDRRATRRERVGPTGRRKTWSILVDSCHRCGRHYPVNPDDLTAEQTSWVERWNTRMGETEETTPVINHDTSNFIQYDPNDTSGFNYNI